MFNQTATKVQPLTIVRRAIRRQRQAWADQAGKPPLKYARSGHGFEPWEHQVLQDNQGDLSLQTLATWTGRTTTEILHYFNAIQEPPEDLLEDEPLFEDSQEPKKKTNP